MKNIILIAIVLFTIICNAQSPTKSLYDDKFETQGAYYKDIYNDLNRFEGTWIYTNGSTSLTVMLQKKEMQFTDYGYINFYVDALIGEYQYIENGTEKVNTLTNLLVDYTDYYDYNIVGNSITKPVIGNPDICIGCDPNDVKVILSFSDPERDIFGYEPEMIFHHYVENGVEKLRLNFRTISGPATGLNGEENEFDEYNIPFGVYVLVKQ